MTISPMLLLTFLMVLFGHGSTPAVAAKPVLDTTGHKVLDSGGYNILEVVKVNAPVVKGGGFQNGGQIPYPNCTIRIPSLPDRVCCVGSIGKVKNESSAGLAASITQSGKGTPILLSTALNISTYFKIYDFTFVCVSDQVWRFKYDDKWKQHYVISGSDCCGKPPSFGGRSWFRIEQSGKHYSIIGCYRVCEGCKTVCKGMGYKNIGGHKILTFSGVPAKFVFLPSANPNVLE